LILEIPIEAGVRYDNPARFIKTMKVREKVLQLPSRAQFQELVATVRKVNKRFSHDAADLIEFLAYGGFRKDEAQNIRWADCDFNREEILVRGDPETGTKNWTVTTVPMIPRMRRLLEEIKADRGAEPPDTTVMCVSRCNGSLRNSCQRLGIPRITHHGLRHLFATTCIESGGGHPDSWHAGSATRTAARWRCACTAICATSTAERWRKK
jgi:integrase